MVGVTNYGHTGATWFLPKCCIIHPESTLRSVQSAGTLSLGLHTSSQSASVFIVSSYVQYSAREQAKKNHPSATNFNIINTIHVI